MSTNDRVGGATRPPGSAIHVAGLSKSYPGVVALHDVDLSIGRGVVHALLGENGAGKSTLVKILSGQIQATSGSVYLFGEEGAPKSVRAGRALGIGLLPQEVALVPNLNVGRNVLMGSDRLATSRLKLTRTENRRAIEMLESVGADIDPWARVLDLSVSEQRLVQLARTVGSPARILILDEPTAVLSDADAECFLKQLDRLRELGTTVIYITHRLGEVIDHCDTASVLFNGSVAETVEVASTTREHLIGVMLGDKGMGDGFTKSPSEGAEVLSVEDLAAGRVQAANLSMRRGEVVGVAGVQGSGLDELLSGIAGIGQSRGTVSVDSASIGAGVRNRYAAGITYVPADRRGAGVVGGMSIAKNVAASLHSPSKRLGFRIRGRENLRAGDYIDRFAIKAPGVSAVASSLSGGNQQKLAIARSLEASPKVLLVCQPTQGVDVGSKQEIRRDLARLAEREGVAILVASSDFEELEGLAERVLVLREGQIVAELSGPEITYRSMLHHALG